MAWVGRDIKGHLLPTFLPRPGTPSIGVGGRSWAWTFSSTFLFFNEEEEGCGKGAVQRQGSWIPCVPQSTELEKQVCSSRKQTKLFPGHRSLWVRLLGAEWGSRLSFLKAETPRSSIQCFCAQPGLGGNTSAEEVPPGTAAAHLGSRLLKTCLGLFTYSKSPKGF